MGRIHPEWRSIVSNLNIKPTEETPFIGGVWARLVDDIQLIHGVSTKDVEPVLRKIKEAVMEPQSIKHKVCGKLPINLVKVSNVAPTTVLIPSEMGLPILIEVSLPSVLSTKGYIDIECSKSIPSVELSLTNKVCNTLTGCWNCLSLHQRSYCHRYKQRMVCKLSHQNVGKCG